MNGRTLLVALMMGGVAGCGKEPTAEETGDPVLTVTEPVHGDAINGTMRIRASCTGDCRSITVKTPMWYRDDPELVIAEGGRSLERDVSMRPLLEGNRTEVRAFERLVITATSSTGVTDSRTIDVYPFDTPSAVEVVRTPGPVLDFDGSRVLYAESSGTQWNIRLGNGNPSTDQLLRTGGKPVQGVIVDQGLALFTVIRNRIFSGVQGWYIPMETSDTDSLFEWRNGAVTLLSATSNTRIPLVEDGIVAWQEGVRQSGTFSPPAQMPLLVRDLATATTTTLTTSSTRYGIDVGAGRTVAWTEDVGTSGNPLYQIVRWRDGAVTRFTTAGAFRGHILPRTDGNLVAFQTYTCCRVELEGPNGRQVLTEFSPGSGSGYVAYDVAGGFAAYSVVFEGRIREPDGTVRVLGTAPSQPNMELVADDGTVVFRERLVLPDGTTRSIGRVRPRVVERNGKLHLLIGNAVYRID